MTARRGRWRAFALTGSVVATALLVSATPAASQSSPEENPLESARRAAGNYAFAGQVRLRWRDAAGDHEQMVDVRAADGAMVVEGDASVLARRNERLIRQPGASWDALWPAGLLLLAQAAWRRDRERPIEVEGRPLLLVPAVSSLVAVGVLVADHVRSENLLAIALSVLTLLAVLARTALSFRENARLLEQTRIVAMTDPVTGLGNRRKLLRDLERAIDAATAADPWQLAIFDLDGFKGYNDTFGHVAGDALLHRLGGRLGTAVGRGGAAYRLGGDEFCVLVPGQQATATGRLAGALAESGQGFEVTSSFGAVVLPTDAAGTIAALRAADQRLYAMKYRKRSHRDRPHDVLLQVLNEREPDLHDHLSGVATLANALGEALGLATEELDDLYLAAQLHDIGKLAIPDAVLHKPGPLDDGEWAFIRQHTIVGQRILDASPTLRRIGLLVRGTHERWDGTGYPDGLRGEDIPLAARIIAVCDAFDAITSKRPYASARTTEVALAELHRCAREQFDPRIVQLLEDYLRAVAAAA